MARLRGFQVNEPRTNYVKYQLPSQPNDTTMVLSGSDFTNFKNASVTGVVGGAEENCPAVLIGDSPGPFININAGDSFAVKMRSLNGGNPIVVTFITGDFVTIDGDLSLTAAKVSGAINRALNPTYTNQVAASDNNGSVQISSVGPTSADVGSGAWAIITDVGYTENTLSRLEFGASTKTAYGVAAKKRGIITSSLDGRGGYFPLRYANGETVLTQTSTGLYAEDGSYVNTVGGQTVYGRLSSNGTSITLSFFAFGLTQPALISSSGDFSALGTYKLRITHGLADGAERSFETTFGTINSVTDVVNAINTAFNTSDASPRITAKVPEPYQLNDSDSIVLKVDATSHTITFSAHANESSTQSVVDIINAAFGSIVAYVHQVGSANYIQVKSSTTGPSALVQIGSGSNKTTLAKLGMQIGTVTGANTCSVSGSTEIKIFNPFCDSSSEEMENFFVKIEDVVAGTCAKMGLVPDTTKYAPIEEHPVVPPAWPVGAYGMPIVMLIPESLEFGDVPNAESTTLQEFMNQDTVSQIDTIYNGIENSNKPVLLDKHGLITPTVFPSFLPHLSTGVMNIGSGIENPSSSRLNIPYIQGATSVKTLLFKSDGIPITDPPSSTKNTYSLRNYADSSTAVGKYVSTWNAWWNSSTSKWNKDISGKAATLISHGEDGSLRLGFQSNIDNTPWSDFSDLISVSSDNSDNGPTFQIANNGWLSSAGTMMFSDENIIGSGSGERLQLTSATALNGDFIPRVADKDAFEIDGEYSILRSLNARAYVTCGNGSTTFGDFNGTTAVQDAIAFLVLKSVKGAVIYVKPGTYTATSTISVSGMDLTVIGTGRQVTGAVCTIQKPSTGNTITFTRDGNGGRLRLENLSITANSGFYGVETTSGALLHADNCTIEQLCIRAPATFSNSDNVQVLIKRCQLNNVNVIGPTVSILDVANAAVPLVFEDCGFFSNTGIQTFFIKAVSGISGVYHMAGVLFNRCLFQLGTATMSGNNLNANTGILDLDPNGNDVRAGNGLIIDKVSYSDCSVACHTPAGGMNVLLHLLPTANGTNADTTGAYMYIDSLTFENTTFTHQPPTTVGHTNAFTIAYGARSVTVKNCKYDLTGPSGLSVHGTPTYDVAWAMHAGLYEGGVSGTPNGSWVGIKPWGSMAVMADDIKIDGLEMTGLLQLSASYSGGNPICEGDVYLLYCHILDVRNVNCHDYSGHAGSSRYLPRYRWHIFNLGQESMTGNGLTYKPSGVIDHMILQGRNAIKSGSGWSSIGHVRLNASDIHVKNSSIIDFKLNDGSTADDGSGFMCYVDGNWDAPWYNTNFKITDCTIQYTNNGIEVDLLEETDGAGGFEISRNNIEYCKYGGIHLTTVYLKRSGLISANNIGYCTKPGIIYYYKSANHFCSVNIVDNLLKKNFSADTSPSNGKRQIHIFPAGTGTGYENLIPAVFLDRNCCSFWSILDDFGYIGISLTDGTGTPEHPTTPGPIPGSGSYLGMLYGAETGLNATPATYKYVDEDLMVRNQACLKTPSTAL